MNSLETRIQPATFVVTNTSDLGAGSLREAVTKANMAAGADVIDMTGIVGTISLMTALSDVTGDVAILGPGSSKLTVQRDSGAGTNFRIFTMAGTNSVSGLTISGGIADGGGGIQFGGTLTLSKCVLTSNSSTFVGTFNGGGAINIGNDGILNVNDSTITGNASLAAGGAIFCQTNGTMNLNNTTISNNSAGANGFGGGGGGLYFGFLGQLAMTNCTVSGNTSTTGSGAGIYIYPGDSPTNSWVIRNSTIANNSTGSGGGALALLGSDDQLLIQNTTITGNSAISGGALFVPAQYSGNTITFQSSIISGNTGGTEPEISCADPVIATKCAIDDTTGFTLDPTSSGNLLAQPYASLNLGTLQNNGGPTETQVPGAGSPLINAGFNAIVQGLDQRGFQRTAGPEVDIGAAEANAGLPAGNIPAVDIVTNTGGTSYTFQVIYTDDTAVKASSIDLNDLTITGPGGVTITTGKADVLVDGTPRIGIYTITPPGGTWDPADNGTYIVRSVAGQVTDTSSNGITAGIIGQFKVATIQVTNTNDSGPGSLRQAIIDANKSAGVRETIGFAIGTGTVSIQPTSSLPVITDPVVLDATTQPGFAGTPIVELAGNLAGAGATGLIVNASDSIIRGFVINRFDTGVNVGGGAKNTVIQGNYIGTNVAGSAALGNAVGVFLSGTASGILVGSNLDGVNDAAERNVISGNTSAGVRASNPTPVLGLYQWTTGTGANNHYYVTTPVTTWLNGEAVAAANGGHLVSITSHDEQVFIATNVLPFIGNNAWIGYTDDPAFGGMENPANDGTGWVWSSGEPGGPTTYQNFGPGEPNNAGAGENQGEITGGLGSDTIGSWNDNSEANGNRRTILEFNSAPDLAALNAAFGVSANAIQGNYIGTDVTGAVAVANGAGVDLAGSTAVTVRNNVISGNTGNGVHVGATPFFPLVQWPTSDGGNNHFYVIIPSTTWTNAESIAVAAGGHLASIVSKAENDFILNNVGTGWIGLTDDVAFGGMEFGNTSGLTNRGEGWVWLDGTPPPYPIGGPLTGYQYWNGGEPNNAGGAENFAEITGGGGWNDLPTTSTRAGILEFTSPPNQAALGAQFGLGGYHNIIGNNIGANAAGNGALGNGGSGVRVDESPGVSIGGTGTGAGNTIRNNTGAGISITGNKSLGVATRGNAIFSNGGLGLDLGSAGVTPNDVGDSDTGPNGLQNFPVVSSAAAGTNTKVSGSFNGVANTKLTLDFYASTAADPSGNGEGQRFLGSTSVMTDGGGNATFTGVVLTGASSAGEFITATATDPNGNTSEFSVATKTSGVTPPTVSAITINDGNVQRSMVTSIKVTFSEAVSFPSGFGAAFDVSRTGKGTLGSVNLSFTQSGADVTITFASSVPVPLDPAGSLPDGQYLLTIFADKVMGSSGTLDGNGNGIAEGSPTDNRTSAFHRLFGDGNGDGNVISSDFAQFRSVFGVAGPTFDFDGNGVVNSNDFAEFRKRFGLTGYLP